MEMVERAQLGLPVPARSVRVPALDRLSERTATTTQTWKPIASALFDSERTNPSLRAFAVADELLEKLQDADGERFYLLKT